MSNDQITTENHDTQSSHTPSHHDDDSYDSSLDSQNGLIEQLSSSLGLQDEEFSTSADGNIPSILADLSRAQDLANSIDSRLDGILILWTKNQLHAFDISMEFTQSRLYFLFLSCPSGC
ncbi:hypothetical protein DFH28DRAFT_982649 [Melampsora americana]|nr:hypothetical protein DFH28DRAFT_982649 [Melampsora americana]